MLQKRQTVNDPPIKPNLNVGIHAKQKNSQSKI